MVLTKTHIKNFLSFRSIQSKLIGAFVIFICINFFIVISVYWFTLKQHQVRSISDQLHNLSLEINFALHQEKDFFIYETINPVFFKNNKSAYLDAHQASLRKVNSTLKLLQNSSALREMNIQESFQELNNKTQALDQLFTELVNLVRIRGFKDYGREGKMRDFIHQIEDSIPSLNLDKVLMVRRHEKDYILRKESKYVKKLLDVVASLKEDATNRITDSDEKRKARKLLELYQANFLKLVEEDKQIGFYGNEGLKGELARLSREIEALIKDMNQKAKTHDQSLNRNVLIALIICFVLFFVLNIALGYFVIYHIRKPIKHLSDSIHEVIQHNFQEGKEIFHSNSRDEVGGISQDVRQMLSKVRQRTQEVIQEKEKVEQAYDRVQLLSKIGQEITANLSTVSILNSLRDQVSALMSFDVFAIGIYNERRQRLDFVNEKESQFQQFQEKVLLSEKAHLCVQAFENDKDFLVGDFSISGRTLKNLSTAPAIESILLIPLRFRDKPIGVLTVQSAQKKAYTPFHLNLLKSIATHLTIALDNAQIHQKLQLNHKKFKDSINYAEQIQKALLPELGQIQKVIPNSFVLLKPRDVVSGDFYWFAQADLKQNYQKAVLNHVGFRPVFSKVKQSKYFLVVADCTGHGVPGALMSMIGHDLLNEIILHYRESDAAHVLNRLHEGVKSCFRQENQSVGMDLGLCILDFEERVLEYAGAFMPLVHIQDGEMQIIPGDKKPIGVWYEQKEVRQYQKHQIELSLEKESTFYIATDGYQDQLGGPKRKKMLSSKLHRLLLEIHQKPMEEQKQLLDENLLKWQGKEKQNDDILVMGFRVSPNDLIYHY